MWRNVKNIANMLMDDPDVVEEQATGPIVEGVDYKLGRIQFGLLYDFQNLTLTLRIIRAVDLPAKDVTGTSDPYVKILLLPDKKHKLLTKVKKRNLNPHWNECFLFEGGWGGVGLGEGVEDGGCLMCVWGGGGYCCF